MQKQFMVYCGVIFAIYGSVTFYSTWAQKEARIEYFRAAAACYESSKTNPPLAVICPKIDIKDARLK